MGTSLTESPSDFGTRCPPPEQLELLDQMAIDFVNNHWSIKHLVREIMLSRVYQQQSLQREDAAKVDPTNSLYWRANRRRRDFESMRDGLLAVTGQLDAAVAGKSEKISEPPYSHRRTVYAYIDRQNLPNLFRSFDFASPDTHVPARPYTSVPQQSLYLMNSDFVATIASNLGSAASAKANDPAAVASAASELFRQVLGRQPSDEERQLLVNFLTAAPSPSNASTESLERWICGYGTFDAEKNSLVDFKRLPKFTGTNWQGGDALPDPQLGWCTMNAAGGHPGNDCNMRYRDDGSHRVMASCESLGSCNTRC